MVARSPARRCRFSPWVLLNDADGWCPVVMWQMPDSCRQLSRRAHPRTGTPGTPSRQWLHRPLTGDCAVAVLPSACCSRVVERVEIWRVLSPLLHIWLCTLEPNGWACHNSGMWRLSLGMSQSWNGPVRSACSWYLLTRSFAASARRAL